MPDGLGICDPLLTSIVSPFGYFNGSNDMNNYKFL